MKLFMGQTFMTSNKMIDLAAPQSPPSPKMNNTSII